MSLAESVAARLRSADFDNWMAGAARTGFCTKPVRLAGASTTLNPHSGEVIREFLGATQPDGLTYTRCGNRRARRCESCSHEYKGDTWHMITAGAAGGMKGVPETVGDHPMAFVTLTAPSFGSVHSTTRSRLRGVCAHGRPRGCTGAHEADDAVLGDPVCEDCYDYVGHLVWQFHAPELWRRFTIQLRRSLARELGLTQREAAQIVRVQFAKVAEFQRRGAVHFHAIIRLDGVSESEQFPPTPAGVTETHLANAVRAAARSVSFEAPLVNGEQTRRILRWGAQLDVQPIVRREGLDGALSDRAVAAYIAKYATKATEDLDGAGGLRIHIHRIKATAQLIGSGEGADGPYALLSKWVHMLGFRGHFSSKSRRYSVTLGSLRGARRRWRLERVIERARADGHDLEEVLVIGSWSFAGMGWRTDGDRALATEAARAVREWRDARRVRFEPTKGEKDA
ncbi:replication initiation protein [Microbacterium sp. MEC084]|uniref:replication initiator n=1 Tax=Microbacterium sp. MEC084 TaxID=1963027 RepID=UPI00106F8C1A|nr:replication initiator [Microbacterium sp. MEC084]MCD1267815.1 replication initiation protein [Microbacterium sp. MEC084]